jgi:hypothetical protein
MTPRTGRSLQAAQSSDHLAASPGLFSISPQTRREDRFVANRNGSPRNVPGADWGIDIFQLNPVDV